MTKTDTQTTDTRSLARMAEETRKIYQAALRAKRAAYAHVKDCEKAWLQASKKYELALSKDAEDPEDEPGVGYHGE